LIVESNESGVMESSRRTAEFFENFKLRKHRTKGKERQRKAKAKTEMRYLRYPYFRFVLEVPYVSGEGEAVVIIEPLTFHR
jgi:hypothetical protein